MILSVLLWLAPWTAAQTPAAPGVLNGTVLNANTGQPGAGLMVSLDHYEGMTQVETLKAETDAQGRFKFAGLPVGDNQIYLARVTYNGAEYYSDMITFPVSQTAQSIALHIYESSDDDSGLVIERTHLIVRITAEAVSVDTMVVMSNNGKTTFAGKKTAAGKPATVLLTVPAGATALTFQDAALGDRFVAVEGGVADTQPVPPGQGTAQIVYSYNLPGQKGPWTLEYRLPYAAKAFNVLLAEGWTVQSESLSFAGTMGSAGSSFLNYVGQDLPAGAVLRLAFAPGAMSGASSAAAGTQAGLPSYQGALLWMALAATVVAVIAGVTYPYWRSALHGQEPPA